ncbi:MAG: polyprenyl synthetase family protein [Candidatus Bathyarchaeota archaeon]|nr:polyprenyl synthetase family protein [Candidatus Bathyarchaeota archaeon]
MGEREGVEGLSKLLDEIKLCCEEVDRFIFELLESDKDIQVLYQSSIHLFKAGGKRVRPFLTIKACEAVGGDPSISIPVASAIEILHTFTLIHDDIMDESDLRRGVPTVHTVWGIPQAITSGDYLFAKVFQVICRSEVAERIGYDKIVRIAGMIAEAMIDIAKGQTLDLLLQSRMDVSEEEYLEMIRLKTARLFQVSAEIGALIGGCSYDEFEALSGYGLKAGLAFQIVDDILGLVGSEEELGKPIGSDLREGKKTIVVIQGLRKLPARSKSIVTRVLGRRDASNKDVKRAIETLIRYGCVEYAKDMALRFRDESIASLSKIKPSPSRASLEELARLFVDRRL